MFQKELLINNTNYFISMIILLLFSSVLFDLKSIQNSFALIYHSRFKDSL